jgi:ATP-dependent DNA ligase
MLAHKYEEKRIKYWPVYVEPKLDGVRVVAFVTPTDVKFYSRTGKEFTTFDHLKKSILDLKPNSFGTTYVLDGEVVSGSFNETVSQVRRTSKQATDAEFHAFDILPMSLFTDSEAVSVSHEGRRHLLKDTGISMVPSYLAHSHEDVLERYQKIRDAGGEGVIVKYPTGLYELKRSHAWMKIKGEESVDVRVTGMYEGLGKYVGMLGGLTVDVDGVEVRVGGGFTDHQRETFWNKEWRTRPNLRGVEATGRLIEVEYHEKTPDGSLRHPRFVRFRDDKDEGVDL